MTKFNYFTKGKKTGSISLSKDKIHSQTGQVPKAPAIYPDGYEAYLKRYANSTGNLQQIYSEKTGLTTAN